LRLSRSRIVIVIASCEQKRTYQQQCQQSWVNVHFHNGHVLSVTSPSTHTQLRRYMPTCRMKEWCYVYYSKGEGKGCLAAVPARGPAHSIYASSICVNINAWGTVSE